MLSYRLSREELAGRYLIRTLACWEVCDASSLIALDAFAPVDARLISYLIVHAKFWQVHHHTPPAILLADGKKVPSQDSEASLLGSCPFRFQYTVHTGQILCRRNI